MYYTNNYPQELNNEFPEYCENSSSRYPSSKETEYLFQQLDEINDYSLSNKKNHYQQDKTKTGLSKDCVAKASLRS